jgi:hypothetical protein
LYTKYIKRLNFVVQRQFFYAQSTFQAADKVWWLRCRWTWWFVTLRPPGERRITLSGASRYRSAKTLPTRVGLNVLAALWSIFRRAQSDGYKVVFITLRNKDLIEQHQINCWVQTQYKCSYTLGVPEKFIVRIVTVLVIPCLGI